MNHDIALNTFNTTLPASTKKLSEDYNKSNKAINRSSDSENSGIESMSGANNTLPGATKLTSDFMTMLITQIKNQDPMDPMDNNQMTAQLAQLSQLTLLENMDQSMSQLAERKQQDSLSEMVAVIDRVVVVPLTHDEPVAFNLSGASEPDNLSINIVTENSNDSVAINVFNQQGEVVKRKSFKTDEQGLVQFSIADIKDNSWPLGEYYIDINTQSGEYEKSIEGKVKGITLPDVGAVASLDLAGMTQAEFPRVKVVGR